MKSISLPFEIPTFATVQSSGAIELAMIGHPTAYNQILNQTCNIRCTNKFLKGFTSPQVVILNSFVSHYKFMERYMVNFRFVHKYCLEIIKQMLDEGLYIYYTLVDDFYLPGKSWYGTRHLHHDGVICGYDDNDKTLSIAAHDINWVYSLIRIPQECFILGLQSSLEDQQYGQMTAYKIRDNTDVKINEKEMLKHLKEYMNSNFEKYPVDKEGMVLGTVVHDYLAIYIDKLKDGNIPYEKMDWRALRPVWEHKKCMLKRIQAVENKNGWSDELSQKYLPVVEKADRIRMMYAIYHKNHNDKLLDKIRDGLLDIGEQDRIIVTEFIDRLESLTL